MAQFTLRKPDLQSGLKPIRYDIKDIKVMFAYLLETNGTCVAKKEGSDPKVHDLVHSISSSVMRNPKKFLVGEAKSILLREKGIEKAE